MSDHTDTYSLAGGRACVLTYPPDLSADEVDGITNWLQLVVWKLGRIATPHAVRDALRVAELADADAHLADANARCDRLKAEKGELESELAHQRKLVETLCERVEAQSELLSQRAAKKWGADRAAQVLEQCLAEEPPAPNVVVIDDPEADLPAVVEEPKPANTRRRVGKGRATRIKVALALVAKPLTVTQIHAATGIPLGTLGGVLCMRGGGWWAKRFHHKGSPYELTDAGRAALRAEGIDAPDPPAPQGIDRDRERCKLVAQEMVKLIAPQPVIVLATAIGFDADDVRAYLTKHPDWFARVEGGGEYYRLTAQGRELANEQEAA